jgi:hypothetical protein
MDYQKTFDARFEVIHCRIDQRDDKYFLIVTERAAGNDLRGQCREDLRFARAGDSRDTKPPACIAEDLFLGGSRDEIKCHVSSVRYLCAYNFTPSRRILEHLSTMSTDQSCPHGRERPCYASRYEAR